MHIFIERQENLCMNDILRFDVISPLCFIFILVADVIDLTKENEDLEIAIALSLKEAQVHSFHALAKS